MEEKVINIDLCIVCSVLLDEHRNNLSIALEFTQKPIYLLIEEFTETCLTDEIVSEAGLCVDCLHKFNEFDEYQKLAKSVQDEISNLFVSTINNQVKPNENEEFYAKGEPVTDESGHDIIIHHPNMFQGIDDIQNDNDEFVVVAIAEDDEDVKFSDLPIIHADIIERNKLPKKIQNTVRNTETLQVLKTRTFNGDNASYPMVQLNNRISLFQCDICERAFKEKSKMKAHRQIHTNERNIVCPVCNKTFKTAGCLRSHKRIHNPKITECDHCGKTYTQKNELVKHIKFVHFNRRDYKCNQCDAAFGSHAHLKAHSLTHEEFRGIACELCGFAFHTKAKLQRHMNSHTGNRNFSCSICHKRFLYSYNVSAHIKHVHWKEKRKPDAKNKCSICAKKFVHKSTLMEHLQNDHNVVLITEDETITVEEMDESALEDSFET